MKKIINSVLLLIPIIFIGCKKDEHANLTMDFMQKLKL